MARQSISFTESKSLEWLKLINILILIFVLTLLLSVRFHLNRLIILRKDIGVLFWGLIVFITE